MGCYYTLCHSTYAYSLLFYKVYIRRENAGSWNSGLEKEQILENYSVQLQKSWNSTEVVFGNNKKYWQKIKGGPHPSHEGGGCAPLPRGPLDVHQPQLQLHIFAFTEKTIREKVLSRFTIQSRRQALISLGRADLESVRGSGEGDSSSSSSSTILHHQFHDAHRRAWVIPSQDCWTVMGGWDLSCNRVSFVRVWSLLSTMFWDWCCYDFAMLNACH